MKLPDLGIGFVYLPGLEGLSQAIGRSLDVLEVEAQTFWTHDPSPAQAGEGGFRVDRAALARATAIGGPVLVHSVGYPVGGSRDGDARHLSALRETFALLKPAWWSDHASFLAAHGDEGPRHVGFLMPPIQSAESIAIIADRIKRMQDEFGLPFAFETGTSYLKPLAGELPDAEFWGGIAERADCGILLDIHNVWTNELNGRGNLATLADGLPLERVWEIHVAGGQWHKGYWLDSHSGLPPEPVMSAARALVPRLPALHAITLEIIAERIDAEGISEPDLEACFGALRAIWATRGSGPGARGGRAPSPLPTADLPSMRQWELMLEADVGLGRRSDEGSEGEDPGLEIYRDLIAAARRGTLADALPLSMRYLFRVLGEPGLKTLFLSFWGQARPEPFMSDEARNFSSFARARVDLPHLAEVLDFELAAHRAAMTGLPQTVSFTCQPAPLLAALKSGAALHIDPARVEVEVTPPQREAA